MGWSVTCLCSCLPNTSSTAVILHFVGTRRLFFSFPNKPTLKRRVRWYDEIPALNSSETATWAKQSLSPVRYSILGWIWGFSMSFISFMIAVGPMGGVRLENESLPLGILSSFTSVSTGWLAIANSWTELKLLSGLAAEWMSTCWWERVKDKRWLMMSSIPSSNHWTGLSRKVVSSHIICGTMGPA